MDHYLVSARKYRPSTFRDVVGQRALASTLKNAIATGRMAHSYLFCGSRGVGKTSCARIMAKTINCENPTPDGEACNECPSCRAFNAGNSLNIIELDAASNNGVDDIRALTEQVMVPPSSGRYRVFIIDEVHMLSQAAFNAFLKTLEEPPAYVVFILATTEKHKILPTILSRCQIYDFNRITVQDMVDHLAYVAQQENITFEPAALNVIARKADGAMRDALSIFDQVAASLRGNITYQGTIDNLNVLDHEYYNRLLQFFLDGDVLSSWLVYKEIRDHGFDSQFFINGLASYLRDLMVARDPRTLVLLETTDDIKAQMAAVAAKCTPEFLLRAMDLCNTADLNYRTSDNKQFLIELTLAKLCQLQSPSADSTTDGKAAGLRKIAVNPSAVQAAAAAAPAAPPTPTPAATPAQAAAPAPSVQVAQPSVQAAPAPAPAPAAVPRTAAPRSGRLSLSSLSHRADPADVAAASAPAAEKARSEFSDNQLRSQWARYADSRPTEHILINTMRLAIPVRIEAEHFRITVENELQHELMTARMPEILSTLHSALHNDFITIDVEINQGEASPVTWNQREVLQHMTAENKQMAAFISAFDLKL